MAADMAVATMTFSIPLLLVDRFAGAEHLNPPAGRAR
jgi:hypothetical protein